MSEEEQVMGSSVAESASTPVGRTDDHHSTEWQDIASAPKDGTRVLVLAVPNEVQHAPAKVKVGFFRTVSANNFMAPGLWMFEGAEPLSYAITHWKPLPEPLWSPQSEPQASASAPATDEPLNSPLPQDQGQ